MSTEAMSGPVYVPQPTRNWATATLVLAVIALLFEVIGAVRMPKSYAAPWQ